jgi:hypothetical protein
MNNKKAYIISSFILIIALICMGINWFVTPFADIVIRIIGVIMLVDIFVLSYNFTKLKKDNKL